MEKDKNCCIRKKMKVITVLLALALCGCGAKDRTPEEGRGEIASCTMQEAWEIAEKAVEKDWADDAETVFITGLTEGWSFLFHSEKKGTEYSVAVIDGNAVQGKAVEASDSDTFTREEVLPDSTDLFVIAGQHKLEGIEDSADGYQYGVRYYHIANGEENVLAMSVSGLNAEGKQEYILADPVSKDVIASTGELTWEWAEKEFDIFNSCIAYKTDPAELTDRIIEQYYGDYFSPFSDMKSYADEEWRERMEAYYGADWEDGIAE